MYPDLGYPHAFGAVVALVATIAVAPPAYAEWQSSPRPDEPTPPPAAPSLLPLRAAPRGAAGPETPALPEALAPAPSPSSPPGPTDGSSGYRNGLFYIRSADDVFRLYVQGRVHVDHYAWLGPGVALLAPDQALKNGFSLRRARLEMAGEFFQMWQWHFGAEFAPSLADNVAANTASRFCMVDARSSVLSCNTDRQNAVEAPAVKPAPTDAFINFAPSPWANVQVGQFYLPFMLENRLSDNTSPFLERSLAVRSIGAPLQRDIGAMFWGEAPDRIVYYAAGIFNGDGPNRPNADGRYDFAARFVARPLVRTTTSSSKWMQVAASVHAGSRDATQVGYDLPSLTTPEGFSFWKPTYIDSLARLVHIIPSGAQMAVAGDVYLPIENFDFTGEFIYVDDHTREALDGFQLASPSKRTGKLQGYGYYAQVNYWIVGDHDITGYPSYQRPLHLDVTVPQKAARYGLQALARFEQMHLTYRGAASGGTLDPQTPEGNIDVESVSIGVNYWATRHLRLSINYGYYLFPGSAPKSAGGSSMQSASQRAIAPAQNLRKGVDDSARDEGHDVHEISMRAGVQF